jgi:hypothetical protein
METLRAFLSGCMAFLSFSSPKGSAEALPEVFFPPQNPPAPSHTANICRIRRLPTLTERLCEIPAIHRWNLDSYYSQDLDSPFAARLNCLRKLPRASWDGGSSPVSISIAQNSLSERSARFWSSCCASNCTDTQLRPIEKPWDNFSKRSKSRRIMCYLREQAIFGRVWIPCGWRPCGTPGYQRVAVG